MERFTAFTAESFGGHDQFSKEMGGFRHLIDAHRGYHITEAQRQRFVHVFMEAADKAGLPANDAFRSALKAYVDFGSQVSTQNSNATTETELHPLREVLKWHWRVADDKDTLGVSIIKSAQQIEALKTSIC